MPTSANPYSYAGGFTRGIESGISIIEAYDRHAAIVKKKRDREEIGEIGKKIMQREHDIKNRRAAEDQPYNELIALEAEGTLKDEQGAKLNRLKHLRGALEIARSKEDLEYYSTLAAEHAGNQFTNNLLNPLLEGEVKLLEEENDAVAESKKLIVQQKIAEMRDKTTKARDAQTHQDRMLAAGLRETADGGVESLPPTERQQKKTALDEFKAKAEYDAETGTYGAAPVRVDLQAKEGALKDAREWASKSVDEDDQQYTDRIAGYLAQILGMSQEDVEGMGTAAREEAAAVGRADLALQTLQRPVGEATADAPAEVAAPMSDLIPTTVDQNTFSGRLSALRKEVTAVEKKLETLKAKKVRGTLKTVKHTQGKDKFKKQIAALKKQIAQLESLQGR